MSNWRADRLSDLPTYLFVEIDRRKQEAIGAGRDVIDLGVGDPDGPTPRFIVDEMAAAIQQAKYHRYGLGAGMIELRTAMAAFMRRRFDVSLDPGTEVLTLLGSKEGIGHLPIAVINPGSVVLVPEPGYPVYQAGTVFAGGVTHMMPLREQDDWLPRLRDIPESICSRARMMFLNYPNNPTSAQASLVFFEEAVAFAKKHDLLLVQDAAYTEIYFDEPPPSVLQVPGAMDVCVEMHSLSKTFNMTGWRLGFAVGNRDALAALAKVKANLDSGVFGAIQRAGIVALNGCDHPQVRAQWDAYRRRRDVIVAGLNDAGWSIEPPSATFYIWAKCPNELDSMTVAKRALDEADVVLIPGAGFGPSGEGYVRMALTVDEDRSREAVRRLAEVKW